jgi:addiction module HigA family antidote
MKPSVKRIPPHPGETILEDILKPLDMSVNRLAKALGITAARLNEIVRGKRGITADPALPLARLWHGKKPSLEVVEPQYLGVVAGVGVEPTLTLR